MEVMRVLHMNKGDDENSYAKNSKVQSKMNISRKANQRGGHNANACAPISLTSWELQTWVAPLDRTRCR
uniref:Uncharacterized protein n=1 Tax=Salix viminalis TaxID=40686 RepID=A0A6N2LDQ2_SALVM